MPKQRRFTLERGKWYAADFIADDVPSSMEGGYGYSPIYVLGISPNKSGKRLFDLKFYHANYPAGVNDKEYSLKTVHRGNTYILAHTTNHKSIRFLCIHDLTEKWMRKHFDIDPQKTVEDFFKRNAPSKYPLVLLT